MIVCHCMNITNHDIDAAIDWMRAADGQTIITPGKVYRALGKSADCGGCMPLFLATMRRNDNLKVPPVLCEPHAAEPVSNQPTQDDTPCKAIPRSSNTSTTRSAAS